MRRRLSVILFLAASLQCAAQNAAVDSLSGNITLQKCLSMAMEGNPYVRNARLDLEVAKLRQGEALWEYFPTVNIQAFGYYAADPLIRVEFRDLLDNSDAAWNLNNTVNDFCYGNGLHPYYTTLQRGIGVAAVATQPLYAGGRIIAGNRLAGLGVKAASLQSSIKERDTRAEIEEKYWRIVSLQHKMNTLSAAKNLLSALKKDVGAARDAGLATESDYMQVRSKASQVNSRMAALSGGLNIAKMDLFNAIGMEYRFLELDSYVFEELSDSLASPEQLLQGCDGTPLESELLQLQVEAKKLEKKMAVGEYLPEVGIGVSYGYMDLQQKHGSKMNAIGFASVKIPLTGIGKAVSRARRYDCEVQKALGEKEYLDDQLVLQQRKLFYEAVVAYDAACVSRDDASDAQASLARAGSDYRAGRITLSTYMQAELDCIQAEDEYQDRLLEYRNAIAAYKYHYAGQ